MAFPTSKKDLRPFIGAVHVTKMALLALVVLALWNMIAIQKRSVNPEPEPVKLVPKKVEPYSKERALQQMKSIIEKLNELRNEEGRVGSLPQVLRLAGIPGFSPHGENGDDIAPGAKQLMATGLPSFLESIHWRGSVMKCDFDRHLRDDASHEKSSDRIVIAADLSNNQRIMHSFVMQLLRTLASFPEDEVGVSIYESGSRDHTTEWMKFLGEVLEFFQIRHVIVVDGSLKRRGQERIEFLASVRNAALEPVFSWARNSSAPWKATKVVFINDVYFCPQSIIRLLKHQGDIACGLDWERFLGAHSENEVHEALGLYVERTMGIPFSVSRQMVTQNWFQKKYLHHELHTYDGQVYLPVNFYDKWVAHDAIGRTFNNTLPLVHDEYGLQRIKEGLPFPVHACWNGLVALNAMPFHKGLRFRSHIEDECEGSECMLVCQDFIRLGYDRIIVDPGVRVAYTMREAQSIYSFDSVLIPFVPWEDLSKSDPPQIVEQPRVFECCPKIPYKDFVDFSKCGLREVSEKNYTRIFLEGKG